MSVLTTFRVIASEFASTADTVVDDLTDVVSVGLDGETFGSRMTLATARLVAHELTLIARASSGGAGAGPITSVRTGDLSVSYAAPGGVHGIDDAYYTQTHHGLAYLQIRGSRSGIGFGLLQ